MDERKYPTELQSSSRAWEDIQFRITENCLSE